MGHGWTRWCHEWTVKYAFTDETDRPETFEVFLYNDEADDLTDDAETEDVESEPTSGNYERIVVGFGDDLYTNIHESFTQWRVVDGVEFNVVGTSGVVDSWGVAWDAVLERDIHAAWIDSLDDPPDTTGWEDDYLMDAHQEWEDDPEFDVETVEPSEYIMARGPLTEPVDLGGWANFVVGPRYEVYGLD